MKHFFYCFLSLFTLGTGFTFTMADEQSVSVERTNKKILSKDGFSKPWTIQILAMRKHPHEAGFFDDIDHAFEVIGQDKWYRYFIGEYDTEKEAQEMLKLIKQTSSKYKDAFVIRAKDIKIHSTYHKTLKGAEVNIWQLKEDSLLAARHRRDSLAAEKAKNAFHFAPEIQSEDSIIEQPYKDAEYINDETKWYAVQILASRYPIYVKEIVEFDDVAEFYMPDDNIYRYTTRKSDATQAQKDLKKALDAGYTEAVIINYKTYEPYIVK